ncbi:cofactor-independent phosphoglycerate mutase [Desulfofustis limnaeus]|uniref:2,3-bisphosphoglycerate-independent phosphoglycerate mutase n=1 Tax=Desulfofustis limnaeus TaxID=2740163 RepID=A0ABN6M7M9_9BACT|nr:cofactor-independent phosphoglycerate mutase [Desulfofustis limnaeus]BDD88837.1 putative 2,3-bisphosphoglycerate-independent phosphoglycerate mutase [Desulfofustis limnaeus]
MKYLILVGDGMGDRPIAELGGRTPLQAAATPAMDALSRRGTPLRVATVPDGFHPGSDVANMSLLGYDPARYYTGRAPLEAASMGITLAEDEIAFRCNLVTTTAGPDHTRAMVDFSAGHISNDEAAQLIEALQQACGNEHFRFHAGISYRHLLVVKEAIALPTTVPPHDYIGKDVSDAWQAYLAIPAWDQLVRTAETILADHPVNRRRKADGKHRATAIWPWGMGKTPTMPTLRERFNITGTMISAVDLLNGLGVCAGLTITRVPGATGYIDTNYEGKAQAALTALEQQDFVFVHLEAPDEAGHQGRLDHKLQAIEDFDAKIVAPIVATLRQRGEPFRVIVTMDHFTPLAIQTHTADPVPAILYDSRETEPGSNRPFDEQLSAATGNPGDPLPLLPGHQMIELLLTKHP